MIQKLAYEKPIIITYQHDGYATAILQAQKKSDFWQITQFIPLRYNYDLQRMEYDVEFFFESDFVFLKGYYSYPIKYVENGRITKEIISFLDNQKYVAGLWDEIEVPEKMFYQKKNFKHIYMLTGYDSERKVFFCSGINKSGHWSEFEVSFDVFIKANLALGDKVIYLHVFKVNEDYEFIIDKDKICRDIYNYTYAESEKGINACLAYQKDLLNIQKNARKLIPRETIFLLKEHANLMEKILIQLEEDSDVIENIKDEYEIMKKKYNSAMSYVLKYNLVQKVNYIDKILELIRECYAREKELLEKWLSKKYISS